MKKKEKNKNQPLRYSELKKKLGFEKLTAENMDEWAKISHALHSIGHESQKYHIKYLKKYLKKITEVEDFIASYQPGLFEVEIPFPSPKEPKFTFIDLFAGIGGFRIAMQELGGKCVFSSEWDHHARITYEANFGETPYGDITKIDEKEIPEHDILCAGFPCQAFSIAGYREGFSDKKGRGNLFFDIIRIVKFKKPKIVFLENVKNLKSHDKGNTFKIIRNELEKAGYEVFDVVLNTMDYGNIPQNRERIYIVALKKRSSNVDFSFEFPSKIKLRVSVRDILEDEVDSSFYYNKYECYKKLKESVLSKETVYQWRRMYVRENKKGVCPTLTANMGTGGHNVPIILDKKDIRKLTPRECLRFQGFPEKYILPNIPPSQLYKQAGNTVSLKVVKRIGENIAKVLERENVF
ncbi:MAG: DNA cytosine methyltransferase [bacterium]